jgi:hypothetical protein
MNSSQIMNKSLSISFSNLNATNQSHKDSKNLKNTHIVDLNSSKYSNTINRKKSATNSNNNNASEIHKTPFYPPSIHNSSKNLRKTIADNNLVPYDNEKSTLYSTWTPLSDEKSNQKVLL